MQTLDARKKRAIICKNIVYQRDFIIIKETTQILHSVVQEGKSRCSKVEEKIVQLKWVSMHPRRNVQVMSGRMKYKEKGRGMK